MREILFRAKRKNWRELPKEDWWVEGSYHHQTDYYGESCDKHYIIDGTETDMEGYGGHYEIDPETICQFTGLMDKNGKRIWENDILHRAYHSEDDCIVMWYDGRFCFKTIHGQYNQDPMTLLSICFVQKTVDRLAVIGNVFDDKNLLGKTNYRREQEKETED